VILNRAVIENKLVLCAQVMPTEGAFAVSFNVTQKIAKVWSVINDWENYKWFQVRRLTKAVCHRHHECDCLCVIASLTPVFLHQHW
jgi:hypothetical protein